MSSSVSSKDAQLYSLATLTLALLVYTVISIRQRNAGGTTCLCVVLAGALSANAPAILEAISTIQVRVLPRPLNDLLPKVPASSHFAGILGVALLAVFLLFFKHLFGVSKTRLTTSSSSSNRTPSFRDSTALGRPRERTPTCSHCLEWSQLPESIMCEILRRLKQEDTTNLRMVCRDWYQTVTQSLESLKPNEFHPRNLARDFPLLRILDLSQCVEDVTEEGLQSIKDLKHLTRLNLGRHHNLISSTITDRSLIPIQSMAKIKSLNIAQCVHITDRGLYQISQGLRELQEINLSGCVGVTDRGVHDLASIRSLQVLELPWCLKISDQGLQYLTNLPNLKTLNISGCQLITEAGIGQIGLLENLEELNLLYTGYTKLCVSDESLMKLRNLRNLKILSLGGMQLQHTRITDRGIKTISHFFPHLTHLTLMWIDVTDEGILSLSNLTLLEHLSLKGCGRITQRSMKVIGGLVKLKELSLLYNPWLNLNEEEVLEELSPLTGIEKLSLGGDPHNGSLLTDNGMAILATFQHLQNLNLSYFQYQFAGSGLGPLLRLQTLENVDLTGSNHVNDSTLSVLGQVTSIRSLILNKCSRVSSIGLKHLLKLAKLSFVSLAGCFRVDDRGLEYLSEIPSLTSLILSQCIGLTDAGISQFRKLQKLKNLDLFGCREIRGEGFNGFRDLPLGTLNISDCPYLIDEGLTQIGRIQSLTKLDLCACVSVTDEGIKDLKGLTNLTGIDLGMCGRLGDLSMEALSQLPRLTTFKISGSDLLTDQGVKSVSKKTGLLTVHFDRCQNLSDLSLQHLASCRSLTSLKLARCPKITDLGIVHLTVLDQLSILNLSQCPLLTEQGIQALASLTSLASLEV